MMEKRLLGRSNLEVSPMGLGCWAIGGPWSFDGEPAGWGQVDDAESTRAIHCALEAGLHYFGTAANYGCGHSERVLGRAVAGRRPEVILAIKCGYVVDEERRVVTRAEDVVSRIPQGCEDSLRRLGTDYIDLYQPQRDDYPPAMALDVADALERLVDAGKIRWYGWSTNNPEGARVFAQGQHCAAIQHTLSMKLARPPLVELPRTCEEQGLASINRYPLGRGFLPGKYGPDSTFPEDDFRHGFNLQEDWAREDFRQVDAVRHAFEGDPRTLPQIALGWIWARSDRTIPILGFKTAEQVKETVKAMGFGPLHIAQFRKVEEAFGRPVGAIS